MSPHRRALNVILTRLLPIQGHSLEIGNGAIRRGLDMRTSVTLDHNPDRKADILADAMAMPCDAAAFDAVVCCETLQYVDNPAKVLSECARVLRRGGRLIVSVPYLREGDAPDDRWRWTEAGLRYELRRFDRVRVWPIRAWWRTTGWVAEGWRA